MRLSGTSRGSAAFPRALAQPVAMLDRVKGRSALRSQARSALDPICAWRTDRAWALGERLPSRVAPPHRGQRTRFDIRSKLKDTTHVAVRTCAAPDCRVSVTAPGSLTRWETAEVALADCSTGHPRTPTCTRPTAGQKECVWKQGGWRSASVQWLRREAGHGKM